MPALPLRIFRSYRANFYQDDILCGLTNYPEDYFAELTANGFNAIWVRGILRNLATTSVFPELGEEIAHHQDALAALVQRAQQHGVKVLLYLNEPLHLPQDHPFWANYPHVRGSSSYEDYAGYTASAFCTSTPEVRTWMREVTANLFRAIPELGGWFAITASESPAHCYSRTLDYLHGGRPDCPRCVERPPMEIVAETIAALCDGTREGNPDAAKIIWNWSWAYYEEDPQPSLMPHLPKDTILLLDWERGGYRTMPNGKRNFIDEYSLAYVGPSERFLALYAEARQLGLPVMTKLQVGTTHELATVPNLPLIDNLYQKLVKAEELGLVGMLATWNFGNSFSLNTAAVARFVRTSERPDPAAFTVRLAEEYLGVGDGSGIARAIAQYSTAMAYFPFDQDLTYFWPGNYGPAYPLTPAPLQDTFMGWCCIMQERGDDLTKSAVQFTIPEIIELLTTLVAEWEKGTRLFEEALDGNTHPHAITELGVAKAIGHIFRSTLNIYKTYVLRRDRPEDMESLYRAILDDEIANLEVLLPLTAADSRLGFHAECQGQMFSPELIREKLVDLREQRSTLKTSA
jgi:hypothetical protein